MVSRKANCAECHYLPGGYLYGHVHLRVSLTILMAPHPGYVVQCPTRFGAIVHSDTALRHSQPIAIWVSIDITSAVELRSTALGRTAESDQPLRTVAARLAVHTPRPLPGLATGRAAPLDRRCPLPYAKHCKGRTCRGMKTIGYVFGL